ncbi:hypothetical protein ACWGMA_13455 [Streptomyces asiaticus]
MDRLVLKAGCGNTCIAELERTHPSGEATARERGDRLADILAASMARRRFAMRHLPELGAEGAAALVESTLLMAMTVWQCSRPSEAMLAAYASDPALAAMRLDFADLVRRITAVTASGLLARQEEQIGAGPVS